jgi:D-alanyl-lipoteichoic acid acyltransferase DltB (MBOAT superfamily)
MGYVIDVKRGECGAEKNFFKYFLFIAYFPQLLQGPIERYNDLAPQLYEGHGFDADNFAKGGQRIAIGFFKKVVIADMAGIFVDQVLADETQTGVVIALMLLFYAIQLYADFSGFMDIACGVSKLFGIRLAENFDTPYLSLSVAEFWRRWHITLGAWFRDYLYYPFLTSKLSAALMKKRKAWATALATTLGLLLVWVCMGLWHGAAWSFLFYGLYHGGLIILGNLTKPLTQKWIAAWKIDENSALFTLFRMARTFLLVCFGYVFFVTGDIGESFSLIARMFSAFNWNVFADGTLGDLGLTAYSLWQIALGILILVVYSGTMKPRKTYCLYTEREKTFNGALTMVTLMIAVVFAWVLLYALGDYTSDFVYFQF